MPTGPRGERRPADTARCAVMVGRISVGEIEDTRYKEPAKVKAGKAGAKARAKALSPERRAEIAKVAAKARWGE